MPLIHFISLAPNLTNEAGHDYVYHCCVQQACSALDIEHSALVSSNCKINPLPSKWARFFRSAPYPFSIFIKYSDFCRAFLSFRKRGRGRIFFIESFNRSDLCALLLSSAIFSNKTDRIWLLFRSGQSQLPAKSGILLEFLKWLLRKQYQVLTDSDLISRDFAKLLGLSTKVIPIPHSSTQHTGVSKKEKIIFWWPGPPREAKGLKDIQDLTAHLSSNIQLVAAKGSNLPHCTLVDNVLSREEYLSWLHKADVILLPYDPIVYQWGTSGILVECIMAGKTPFVKEGSWLAHELRMHHLEELIIDWSNPNIVSEILTLWSSEQVQTKLSVMRSEYSKFHSLTYFTSIIKSLLPD